MCRFWLSLVTVFFLLFLNFYFQLNILTWSNLEDFSKNPLVVAMIVFFLSSIIGTKVSQKVQDRSWENKDRERKKEKQLDEAIKLFEELSSLMDKRLYLERRVLSAYNDNKRGWVPKEKIDTAFSDYNKFLYEWNFSLNKNICKLEQYFGVEIKNLFHCRIMLDFNWIGILLRRLYFNDKNSSPQAVLKAIEITNDRVFKLDQQMLQRIRDERIGSFIG